MDSEFFVGDIAFCIASGFIAGVLIVNFHWGTEAFIMAGGIIFILLIYFSLSHWAGIFFIALICGTFYYHAYLAFQAGYKHIPLGKMFSLTAIIVDEPEESTKFNVLKVALLSKISGISGISGSYSGEILVFAPLGSEYQYGDEIKLMGMIEPSEEPGDTPAMFPKEMYLVAKQKGFWLREDLIDFKEAILDKFNAVLPPDQASLLGGETVGGMAGMSADLKNQMSTSGTSYVLSMYGYKISMLVALLEALLRQLISRRLRFFLLVAVVILFVVMAGANISAVRGGIAAILLLVSSQIGRLYNSRNAIALTAFAFALWDPTAITQVSFTLSFLSIIGIVYLAKPLLRLFGWSDVDTGFLGWREAVVVATASLLPIIPIIANAFGGFSLSAFPLNVFIFFAVVPVMILGLVLALVSFVSSYAAFFIAKCASLFLLYQLAVIKIFSVIMVPLPISFTLQSVVIIYYFALSLFAWRFSAERR